MNYFEKLSTIQKKNNSLLCIGLDPDPEKMPSFLKLSPDVIFSFNKAIIDATHDLVCAYKPNIGFYMAGGVPALKSLKRTIEYIPEDTPVILDCKVGDVKHTAESYAKGVLDEFGADAITITPYIGFESLEPFFAYEDRGIYILVLTSNPGYLQFQNLEVDNSRLFLKVASEIRKSEYKNLGMVVGATHPEEAEAVRKAAPETPFLIPGIGAQGGDLKRAVQIGTTSDGKPPLMVSGRSIIYSSRGRDFAEAARQKAIETKTFINKSRAVENNNI
ncbi:MAG: orotidine-5'-phosphate decarboxylase [Candidatus Zixiibacteriota bacterium]